MNYLSMLKGKKILITGGAGFIGSNLCEYFLMHNEILCVDNLITGKKENIQDFIGHPNFRFEEAEIRDYEACLKHTEGVDVIFHQAALGSVPRSIKTPLNTNAHNVTGFLNILEAAKQNAVSRVIFATSSSTYGDHPKLPKVEDTIGAPLSPYAVTKQVNELYASVYSRLYNMEIIGLRYFNVYGRKQDTDGAYAAVIPRFIKQMNLGEPITINGDGEQTRDFTFIKDVIQANELAATVQDKKALNTVYKIAFGQRISLNDLVVKVKENFEKLNLNTSDTQINYGPKRVGDIEHSYVSIKKAKQLLNFRPQFSLEEGIGFYLKDLMLKMNDGGVNR